MDSDTISRYFLPPSSSGAESSRARAPAARVNSVTTKRRDVSSSSSVTTTSPSDEDALLRQEWKTLYAITLPSLARSRSPAQPIWPVSLDHCFARIILDNVVGRDTRQPWTSFLKSPAWKTMSSEQVKECLKLGRRIADGEVDLVQLDEESLRCRGKMSKVDRKSKNQAGPSRKSDIADLATSRSTSIKLSQDRSTSPSEPTTVTNAPRSDVKTEAKSASVSERTDPNLHKPDSTRKRKWIDLTTEGGGPEDGREGKQDEVEAFGSERGGASGRRVLPPPALGDTVSEGQLSSVPRLSSEALRRSASPSRPLPIYNPTRTPDAPKPISLTPILRKLQSDPTLTPFRRLVLLLIVLTPRSRYTTYGLISTHLSSSPRAIGSALRNNPYAGSRDGYDVPCHRVLATGGGIGGFGGKWGEVERGGTNAGEKRKLLRAEGVRFDVKGKAVGRGFDRFPSVQELERMLVEAGCRG